jgi:uncharacterized protein
MQRHPNSFACIRSGDRGEGLARARGERGRVSPPSPRPTGAGADTAACHSKEFDMRSLDVVAAVLLVIGGLNWGLWGLFQFDLVAAIFGGSSAILARVVYAVVGIAAVYQLVALPAIQRRWRIGQRVGERVGQRVGHGVA